MKTKKATTPKAVFSKAAIAGGLIALASSTGLGEVIVTSASASGLAGGSPAVGDGEGATYTAELAQFDSSLGTLTGVELTISAWHEGTFNFTSNGPGGGYIVFYIDYSFEVNGFGGTGGNLLFQDWVTEPTVDNPFGSAPGHFNTDLIFVDQGESATEHFGTQLDFANTYAAADPEFAQFIGDGTLGFEIVDWAVFSIATLGEDVSWTLESMAGLTVEATYTYTPIPTPGTLSLLALSGLAVTRRRRSS